MENLFESYDTLFDELYYKFYVNCNVAEYKSDIELIRTELRETLSDSDRKKVLRIIDLFDMIINISTKENFKHGFILAHKLAIEINESRPSH